MSITVEIKECSQPPTWTLSHTHCKNGHQNTEPMSGTGLQTWQSLLWLNFKYKPWCAKNYWCEPLAFLCYEAHTYVLHTSVDYGMAGMCWAWMHTLRYFTSLGSGSVAWTMLCEGEGWGKGNVPWERTYTMVTHFDRLILPSSIDYSTNTEAKSGLSGLPCFYFSLLFHFIWFDSTLWILCTMWMDFIALDNHESDVSHAKITTELLLTMPCRLVFILVKHFNV